MSDEGSHWQSVAGALLSAVLQGSHTLPPDEVEPFVAGHASQALGAWDVLVLLQDYDQVALFPVSASAADEAAAESMDGTLSGRVFTSAGPLATAAPQQAGPVDPATPYAVRLWLPLLDGTDRLGVLAMTLPSDRPGELDSALTDVCLALATLTAELLVSKRAYTDAYFRARRRRELSLAAEMQWSLLPPLTLVTDRLCLAGAMEPAYDVGGDAFDYSLDGDHVSLAIFDAMGHGTQASMMSTMALGAYRHARRRRRDLATCHAAVDTAVREHFDEFSFCTAQFARLDLVTGELDVVNAGHPSPLLIRDRKVVREIVVPPTLPAGLGGPRPTPHVEQLQPGDSVLFYTDGLIEERSTHGELFGLERLTDHVQRVLTAQVPIAETARRLSRELLRARGTTSDDATLLLLTWRSPT